MKLPIQEAPTYEVELPLTKENVIFRPFLVKEQRNLILARDEENTQTIFNAVSSLIQSVSNLSMNPLDLPMVDLEYLFLQIRAKSVGETSELALQCMECDEGVLRTKVDLENIKLDQEDHSETIIRISESLQVEFSYPTAKMLEKVGGKSEAESIKPMLMGCMVRIYDEEEIYELSDHPDSEIEKFVDSLTIDQFETITGFFANLPVLEEKVKYTCDNAECRHEFEQTLRGLQNFF
tara:strand:+ start:1042 stop:1749 length:708 start_codon:yes stop_codon:yes gene_type:complete